MCAFVIEANCDCREMLTLLLQQAGHEVDGFERFADAMAALEQRRPCLVVSDVIVPGVPTVQEFTAALRSLCPKATLIIHTGDLSFRDRLRELMADAFVLKPAWLPDSVPDLLRAPSPSDQN